MTSLSGFWAGQYSYPKDSHGVPTEPIAFDCKLQQAGALLRGTITEADVLYSGGSTILLARLSGTADEIRVRFLKSYIGASRDYSASVQYEGRIFENGNEISGSWAIGSFRGRFAMTRDPKYARRLSQTRAANDTVMSKT